MAFPHSVCFASYPFYCLRVQVRGTVGTCFACSPFNWLRSSELKGVEVGCAEPHVRYILRLLQMDSIPPHLPMNLHMRSFRMGWFCDIPSPVAEI